MYPLANTIKRVMPVVKENNLVEDTFVFKLHKQRRFIESIDGYSSQFVSR